LKEVIINGRVFPSIWKETTKTENPKTQKHSGRAYSDPTANTALGNIEREERRKKRMEQQASKRKRHK